MTSSRMTFTKRLRARAAWGASVRRAAAAIVIAAGLSGCAASRFTMPSDPGVPMADPAAAWQQASSSCAGVRSLTAELALSGRAAGTRLRGRIQAGFEAPGRIRLEGVAPFGQPIFILAADAARATLLLPRDERVVTAASASEILEALAGVRLEPDALRAALAGCVTGGTLTGATEHGDVARFAFADGGVVFARRMAGGWRIVAGVARPFLIEYPDRQSAGHWPARVRISRDLPGGESVDLTIGLSQIETNITLPPEAFRVDVPASAVPMTIDQLRQAGPLGDGQ